MWGDEVLRHLSLCPPLKGDYFSYLCSPESFRGGNLFVSLVLVKCHWYLVGDCFESVVVLDNISVLIFSILLVHEQGVYFLVSLSFIGILSFLL